MTKPPNSPRKNDALRALVGLEGGGHQVTAVADIRRRHPVYARHVGEKFVARRRIHLEAFRRPLPVAVDGRFQRGAQGSARPRVAGEAGFGAGRADERWPAWRALYAGHGEICQGHSRGGDQALGLGSIRIPLENSD